MSVHTEHREPLIRLAKRDDIPRAQAWAIRAAAILLALVTGGLIIAVLGHNPIQVYASMVEGSLGKSRVLRETVKKAIPLLGAAVAIAPAFKMKFWNIGAEGQILAGGIAASYFALFWAYSLPRPVLLVVMAVAGILAGGVWGLIPAVFKARWGTNETLFTLMLNYIVLGFVKYLQAGPWGPDLNANGYPKIPMFDSAALLPKALGVHIGWIIVLAVTALMFGYLKYSKQGYEIAVVGESVRTAQYAGMNVSHIIRRTMFLSGGIAGLVGFLQVSGASGTLTENTAGGIGFTAITVAWLAKLNPFVMIAIAALLAILEKGADTIQTLYTIPASAADMLTGIVLFFMLGCEFFISYRLIVRGKGERTHE
ncbi:ABC transporter permease [Pseudoflavonifractor sp. MCC625]|uniref:ABC transporter permease n=1 Tax=Pseudoflavonifractor sp. MCC625 TaxID=2592647 RepID=UPI001C028C4B|nr:ABC transporter permease [Pseudoflavonifractor sp. MCC625]MBT9685995.1 ABC transporter permease [Pseudoflavonifractor sp. MCC625]